MSLNSSNLNIDEELKGDIDFNFFDNDIKNDSNKKLPAASLNSQTQSLKSSDFDRNSPHQKSSPLIQNQEQFIASGSQKNKSALLNNSNNSNSRPPDSESRSNSYSSIHSHSSSSSTSRSRSRSHSRSRSPSKSRSPSRSRSSSRSRSFSRSRSPSKSRSNSASSRSSSLSARVARQQSDNNQLKQNDKKVNQRIHHRVSSLGLSSSSSTVTDVSPLSSRDSSPMSPFRVAFQSKAKEDTSAHRKPPKSTKVLPLKGLHKDELRETPDEDRVNIELIMKALVELNRGRQHKKGGSSQSLSEKDRLQTIELENQRLLKSLLHAKTRNRSNSLEILVRRPHHSTINRQREQRRIEEENKGILKRLSKIRPTPGMTRNDQLFQYKRQANYGVPLFKVEGGRELQPFSHKSPYLDNSNCRRHMHNKSAAIGSRCSSECTIEDKAYDSSSENMNSESHIATLVAKDKSCRKPRPASAFALGKSSSSAGRHAQMSKKYRVTGVSSSRPEWPSGW